MIELGQPSLIIISNSQTVNGREILNSMACKNGSKCEPCLSLPTASVTCIGKTTGHKACSDVVATLLGKGVQFVKFEPNVSNE